MEVLGSIGLLWDRALSGDPAGAARETVSLARDTDSDDDRAIALAFQAFCELTLCRYPEGAETARRAAEREPTSELARFYADSMRLLASAMADQDGDTGDAVDFDEVMSRSTVARRAGVDTQLALHPLIEAAMATGRFTVVEELVDSCPPSVECSSGQVATWVRLQLVRSLLFRGDLGAVVGECEALATSGALARHPQAGMLVDALLCYVAAHRGDRAEVEARSARVLAEARRVVTYVQVGSCLLVSWSFSLIGQVQRAAALLLASAGGPSLARIKTWDRAFGYDLLVTAALQRGDLDAARQWAALTAPLARHPVAAAAVERALSRIAAAEGELAEALDRAEASAAHDAATGARADELRSRLLVAGAMAAAGDHGDAIDSLGSTARDADELGAVALRAIASRELRRLTDRGGWESLSEREREIAALAAEGHSNRAIASTLFISDRTVQSHISRTLRALGVGSRAAIPLVLSTAPPGDLPPGLTDRQQQVAGLVAAGRSNAEIAEALDISTKTVEKHLAGIFERWGVSSRTAIATIAIGADSR